MVRALLLDKLKLSEKIILAKGDKMKKLRDCKVVFLKFRQKS